MQILSCHDNKVTVALFEYLIVTIWPFWFFNSRLSSSKEEKKETFFLIKYTATWILTHSILPLSTVAPLHHRKFTTLIFSQKA